MNKTLLRKSLLMVAIALAAALILLRRPLSLGLDLRGGTSLILRVNVEGTSSERIQEVVEQTRQILENRINSYGMSETSIQLYMEVKARNCWCRFRALAISRESRACSRAEECWNGTPSRAGPTAVKQIPLPSSEASCLTATN
jgi:preprotein translocase subunit SecF